MPKRSAPDFPLDDVSRHVRELQRLRLFCCLTARKGSDRTINSLLDKAAQERLYLSKLSKTLARNKTRLVLISERHEIAPISESAFQLVMGSLATLAKKSFRIDGYAIAIKPCIAPATQGRRPFWIEWLPLLTSMPNLAVATEKEAWMWIESSAYYQFGLMPRLRKGSEKALRNALCKAREHKKPTCFCCMHLGEYTSFVVNVGLNPTACLRLLQDR